MKLLWSSSSSSSSSATSFALRGRQSILHRGSLGLSSLWLPSSTPSLSSCFCGRASRSIPLALSSLPTRSAVRLFAAQGRHNADNADNAAWDEAALWGGSSSLTQHSSSHAVVAPPVVQWYPGHIAKAERQLEHTMKAVDVVLEVRDARAPQATSHPKVPQWCAGRPRIVVLTRLDAVPRRVQKEWLDYYYQQQQRQEVDQTNPHVDKQALNQAKQAAQERAKYTPASPTQKSSSSSLVSSSSPSPIQEILYVNAKLGAGIPNLVRAIFRAGAHVQERRARRGLQSRPLRVGVLGYPNVGKSALINRLLGRKRARSANTPGITRSLQWIRVRGNDATDHKGRSTTAATASQPREFELLDSPGIIPAAIVDQSDAALLAACNCIGQAAYDNQAVAAYLCEWMLSMARLGNADDDPPAAHKKKTNKKRGSGQPKVQPDYNEETSDPYFVLSSAAAAAAPVWREHCATRYRFDPLDDKEESIMDPRHAGGFYRQARLRTGEDMLFDVADATCQGDPEDASRKILQDFRTGRWGPVCLQLAPTSTPPADAATTTTTTARSSPNLIEWHHRVEHERRLRQDPDYAAKLSATSPYDPEARLREQQERARLARQVAQERGLELPPMALMQEEGETATAATVVAIAEETEEEEEDRPPSATDAIGKGLFDGW